MPRHRSHSIEFKRKVVAECHAGETLRALGRRHDLSRNLIRIRIDKAEAGALDADMATAELLSEYEARIAALERLVGYEALEIELSQKGRATQFGKDPWRAIAILDVGGVERARDQVAASIGEPLRIPYS